MKKLSLLIALCMLISIGGVYAVWTYADSTITPKTGMTVEKVMGDVEFLGAAGAYTQVSNNLKMTVEPAGNTYNTSLVFSGELVVKFVPDPRITDADLARALNAVISVNGVGLETAKYGTPETQIYTLKNGGLISVTESDWEQKTDENGTYYLLTIYGAHQDGRAGKCLDEVIDIGSFNLPSYDEFIAFQLAHQHASFKIDIHAAAAPTPSGT